MCLTSAFFFFRQHKGISEVPSACFYDGELRVTTKTQLGPAELNVWPGSRAHPIAFCHVVGHEETVTMVTEAGVKPSIRNAKEAEIVVRFDLWRLLCFVV